MIEIGKNEYMFEGPYTDESYLKDQSGVYVILGRDLPNADWDVVDIGESGSVQSRVKQHDRANCWHAQKYKMLSVAALYVSEYDRKNIEKELRDEYSPLCGER